MSKGVRQKKQNSFFYTLVATVLILAVFLVTVGFFYAETEKEANETLHEQTKHIKDDIILQMKSDRENLSTMANFAAKLYSDGENYDLLFESFKPIGLYSNIGILNPDHTFVTKGIEIDLTDKISFEEEAARGTYVSGRVPDLTREGEEIIRSAVPIVVDEETVGVLYGVIQLDVIGSKYENMAKEFDAQLFVYDKDTGKFLIDTFDAVPGQLSDLKTRQYNKGYSYEAMVSADKGYTSFKSKLTGENLYVHWSTMEDLNWGIMFARYESQVFEKTHIISKNLLSVFAVLALVMAVYLQLIIKGEKDRTRLNAESSAIRKLLLETNEQYTNVTRAVRSITEFSGARTAFFRNTDGDDFYYIPRSFKHLLLTGEDRAYFHAELFRHAENMRSADDSAIGYMRIVANKRLEKENPELYSFCEKHEIRHVSFAMIAEQNEHVSILAVINEKKSALTRSLLEDVAVCFSIAMNNKKYLKGTELAATTDNLTGVLNRTAYNRDIEIFNEEMPMYFACVYIDVNELHIRNNKYGHAAGDEMLVYIADTLKELFLGERIYRMGGDEFLVFANNIERVHVKRNVVCFLEQMKEKGYHASLGMSYRERCVDCEAMVKEAEAQMYDMKSQYYLSKRRRNEQHDAAQKDVEQKYIYVKTGIKEIDTIASVLQEHYNGIYRVSLKTNAANILLMPSYLGYKEQEDNFMELLMEYIEKFVHSDYHRTLLHFLNFEAIKKMIAEGINPNVTYKRINGEQITLSVYNLSEDASDIDDTLWVFSKG